MAEKMSTPLGNPVRNIMKKKKTNNKNRSDPKVKTEQKKRSGPKPSTAAAAPPAKKVIFTTEQKLMMLMISARENLDSAESLLKAALLSLKKFPEAYQVTQHLIRGPLSLIHEAQKGLPTQP